MTRFVGIFEGRRGSWLERSLRIVVRRLIEWPQYELDSPLKRIRASAANTLRAAARIPLSVGFALKFRSLRNQRKVIFTLVPGARTGNIGDHAQTIAIRAWLKKHYPQLPIVELDRHETRCFLPALKWLVRSDDLIVLKSGNNMGDFIKQLEEIRLSVIEAFPENRIVSMPQTIYFEGRMQTAQQRERMCSAYQAHKHLLVFARDVESERLARQFMPACQVVLVPDFVLSMRCDRVRQPGRSSPRVLLCFRNDERSILTDQQRLKIKEGLPYPAVFHDTELEGAIEADQHEALLGHMLETMREFDAVVTDRFHGMIFSVICGLPCVGLDCVGHKMAAGYDWFRDLPHVAFAHDIDQIPALVERCLKAELRETSDWNAKYFDRIPRLIDLSP